VRERRVKTEGEWREKGEEFGLRRDQDGSGGVWF